jgi:hypothetical protein
VGDFSVFTGQGLFFGWEPLKLRVFASIMVFGGVCCALFFDMEAD